MLDLISMWKNPKMVAFTVLTALLYFVLIYPFQQFTVFEGNGDYLRVGIGIPMAFSFLFGPAAAWGAAIGNVIYDASTQSLSTISIFGFIGNFLIAYIPYKLWNALTSKKPDLRSAKKALLFAALAVLACWVCGLVIGLGLFWLGIAPFMPTAAVIALTDALWAVVLGSIVLALSYPYLSKRRMLYTDILNKNKAEPSQRKF
jgi:energy-coupling factor transport system substrate-specific component